MSHGALADHDFAFAGNKDESSCLNCINYVSRIYCVMRKSMVMLCRERPARARAAVLYAARHPQGPAALEDTVRSAVAMAVRGMAP